MVTQEELEKMSPEEIAELQKQNCIFCKIISGEVPGAKILENKTTVAILDINPATKGHAIVMPKDHFPILPLVPPEVFKQIFLDAKTISSAIKKVTFAGSTSLFIANGALAGQQAPHFLFHIIPDHKFSYPSKTDFKKENDALADSLKNNLGIMMNNHSKREGDFNHKPDSSIKQYSQSPKQQLTKQDLEKKREQIAKIIEENKDVRELLRNDVEGFKKTIEQNVQLKELFSGVDLIGLSNNIKQLPNQYPEKKVEEQQLESKQKQEISRESIPPSQSLNKLEPEEEFYDLNSTEETSVPVQSSVSSYATQSTNSTKQKPEVFLGQNPLEQKDRLFAYFDEKPKAKVLLMSDVKKFKSLLETRPDIQPIFKDINIDKLSEKLNESLGGESHD